MEDAFFDVEMTGMSSGQAEWSASCKDVKNITMAIPPEFEGPGGGASPEDLFALSLINCFGATFKVIAEKSSLTFQDLQVKGRLFPGKNEQGRMIMKKIVIQAVLTGPSDVEKAKRLLEKASGACMIINSTITEKEFTYSIV